MEKNCDGTFSTESAKSRHLSGVVSAPKLTLETTYDSRDDSTCGLIARL
jgi:hypothetical protein